MRFHDYNVNTLLVTRYFEFSTFWSPFEIEIAVLSKHFLPDLSRNRRCAALETMTRLIRLCN